MIFDILLYTSLAICITGVCINFILWTKRSPNVFPPQDTSRLSGTLKKIAATIFSRDFVALAKSFFIDILFQHRTLKTSLQRWLMHFLIFGGFMALVVMHAMDTLITEQFFPYYYSTVNPFFFLRSLFGLMVLTGIGIAVYRRYINKPHRLRNARSDLFLIIIVLAIILSGVLLEGMKMASVTEFTVMVEDYAGLSYDDEDVEALEAFWVKEFALVSSRVSAPFDPDTIELGLEMHESSCMDCHSPNKSAFLGYATAKLLSPVALMLDNLKMVTVFYYFHILVCFAGLALIPFGKLFHVVATPVSLLTDSVRKKSHDFPGGQLTTQLMALDACTHCGTCNLQCSAGLLREIIPNETILPSEKLQALKKASRIKKVDRATLSTLFVGIMLCTSCDRCTVVCPSGIHLKSLWHTVREHLSTLHPDSPLALTGFSFIRKINTARQDRETKPRLLPENLAPPPGDSAVQPIDMESDKAAPLHGLPPTRTFCHCFGCQNCSTICPVVAQFDTPEEQLTLMPHQIMYALGLGMTLKAKKTAMAWSCLSCYQCQENCPQNVSVCDILFMLKNQTFNPIQDKES